MQISSDTYWEHVQDVAGKLRHHHAVDSRCTRQSRKLFLALPWRGEGGSRLAARSRRSPDPLCWCLRQASVVSLGLTAAVLYLQECMKLQLRHAHWKLDKNRIAALKLVEVNLAKRDHHKRVKCLVGHTQLRRKLGE